MLLEKLDIHNFKNIEEAHLEFSPKINCLLGLNGMGKSNLLDAIYYLSLCKSFSGMTDMMLLRRGSDFAMLKGEYLRGGVEEQLTMGLQRGKRKSLRRGGKEYQRLSAHIGLFPAVLVAPHDADLIREGGEERRRWMDMVISQADSRYLDALIRYNAALEHRNRLLRDGSVDHTLYEAVEAAMDITAQYIHERRKEWTQKLVVIFKRYYAAIAGDELESVDMSYRGSLDQSRDGSLTSLLDSARLHDELVKHTSVGPHRDDLEMLLDDMPMKRSGSQGQCKTFTVALRLAQYDFLHQTTHLKPLLLLDDIFDKLDAQRVERIMQLVTTDEAFGQIFITDTNRKHLDEIMSKTDDRYRMWSVTDGTFTQTPSL
ncbi:MAG: DNA replication and repair protein RecF [Bacteroidales bacterium]|nr:DNA replication and repair protein RecF [Bacteroidales bacterium]